MFNDTRVDSYRPRFKERFADFLPPAPAAPNPRAKLGTHRAGPAEDFVLYLETEQKNKLTVCALGCHGSAPGITSIVANQRGVGKKVSAEAVDFNILLGDNIYDDGVKSPTDGAFKTRFSDMYENAGPLSKTWTPGKAPYFAILGNHDHGYHGKAITEKLADQMRAMHQVEHTYVNLTDGWTMPYRYYCVVTPVAVFYFIDSNTYPWDTAGRAWLQQVYGKHKGTGFQIICTHHPFVSFGKRGAGEAKAKDLKKYLNPRYSTAVSGLSELTASDEDWQAAGLNAVVYDTVRADLKGNVDLVLAAHDHHMAAGPLTGGHTYQVISGGGGAPLTKISEKAVASNLWYGDSLDLAESFHGYTRLTIGTDALIVQMFDAKGKARFNKTLK